MGICSSNLTEAQRREIVKSALIDREQETLQMKDRRTIKILLLGTGESGKSTIFKQMQLLYTDGFNDRARHNFRNVIRKNAVEGMQQIIRACSSLAGLEIESEFTEAVSYIQALDSYKIEEDLDLLSESISLLWEESAAIQQAYARRNQFYLSDAAGYYLDKIGVITQPNYLPDNDDILRARLRTTGIVESTFVIENVPFTFLDVGGQRNERRKWIHSFDGVTTILFIAAISEFDQFLYEDESTNRMKESMEVFAQITNSDTFSNTPVILFLNKIDVFRNKLGEGKSPRLCFEDYPAQGLGEEEAAAFIKEKYLGCVQNANKDVFCHLTSAIDTGNIERVWTACRGIILSGVLREAGLSI